MKESTVKAYIRRKKERDIRLFIANLKTQPLALQQWDEQAWTQLMDSAVVFRNGSIEFTFKNGQKALVEAYNASAFLCFALFNDTPGVTLGNNPMVGATVAVAVAVEEAMK